jgi:hypothetical protein
MQVKDSACRRIYVVPIHMHSRLRQRLPWTSQRRYTLRLTFTVRKRTYRNPLSVNDYGDLCRAGKSKDYALCRKGCAPQGHTTWPTPATAQQHVLS